MLKFLTSTPPHLSLLDPSKIEATTIEATTPESESYNKPGGDGSLIDRPDVIRAVATILILINLVSVIGYWRLQSQLPEEPLNGPLRFVTDINAAPASELSLLPGIGYELANRIVENRESYGPFRSIEDLNRVRGIGPKTLTQIEPMVVFGPEIQAHP